MGMIGSLRQILRRRAPAPPAVAAGRRVYAVGDIHGRLDLFHAITDAIDTDDRARGEANTTCILLGDLVDRGPHSADVVAHAIAWSRGRAVQLIAGNHEEMFLIALEDIEAFRHFVKIGGRETIDSYGVDPELFDGATYGEAMALARAAIPADHLDFLASAPGSIRIDDYLFAHAGIRPGVDLASQSDEDLRWIREPFLASHADHGCIVVHGHTITEDAVVRHNRIGLDTGAYRSGRLTAIGIEGTRRWLIEARTGAGDEAIAITQRPV